MSLTNFCEPCSRDNERVEAFGFCNGCAEYMCENCWSVHIRVKSLQDHTLRKSWDGVGQESGHGATNETHGDDGVAIADSNPCMYHPSKSVNAYCSYCDEICCPDCVAEDHVTCYVINFPDISSLLGLSPKELERTRRNDLDTIIREKTGTHASFEAFDVLRKRTELVIEKQKAYTKQSERKFKDVQDTVGDFYDDITKWIDIFRDEVLTASDETRDDNVRQCREVTDVAYKALAHLQAVGVATSNTGRSYHIAEAGKWMGRLRQCLINGPRASTEDNVDIPKFLAAIKYSLTAFCTSTSATSPEFLKSNSDDSPGETNTILLTASVGIAADRGNKKLKIIDIKEDYKVVGELVCDLLFSNGSDEKQGVAF